MIDTQAKNRKRALSQKWRRKLFGERGQQCEFCGEKPSQTKDLHLAHISDAITFVRDYKRLPHKEAIELYFRHDNLLILCRVCHAADSARSTGGRMYFDKMVHNERERQEAHARKWRIAAWMSQRRKARGWGWPREISKLQEKYEEKPT